MPCLGVFKEALVNYDSIDPTIWSQNILGGIPKERFARTFEQLRFIGLSDVLLDCVLKTLFALFGGGAGLSGSLHCRFLCRVFDLLGDRDDAYCSKS